MGSPDAKGPVSGVAERIAVVIVAVASMGVGGRGEAAPSLPFCVVGWVTYVSPVALCENWAVVSVNPLRCKVKLYKVESRRVHPGGRTLSSSAQ